LAATFTVEDGTGVSGANSYLTIADADQYHLDIGTAAASWDNLSDAVKQQALRDGTRYLDAAYGERWKGARADGTNPLDWPRSYVIDTDGFDVESNVIPQGLKDACAEAAFRATTETLTPDVTTPGTVQTLAEQIGPIKRTKVYHGGQGEYKRFTVIERLLHDLVEPEGGRLLERA